MRSTTLRVIVAHYIPQSAGRCNRVHATSVVFLFGGRGVHDYDLALTFQVLRAKQIDSKEHPPQKRNAVSKLYSALPSMV